MQPALLTADPISEILLLLAALWLVAKVGGELALRLKLPVVAGELGAGIVLASLHQHFPGLPDVAASPAAGMLGGLGVVILMFAVVWAGLGLPFELAGQPRRTCAAHHDDRSCELRKELSVSSFQ
jgi:Kef-type K+ transport system membrane component KefB